MAGRDRLIREALGWTFCGGIALRHLQNHPRRLIGELPLAAELPPSVGTPGNLLVRARLVREAAPARVSGPRAWSAMVREIVPHEAVQVALWDEAGDLIHTAPGIETDGAGMIEQRVAAPAGTASVGLYAAGAALPQRGTVRLLTEDAPPLVVIADVDRTFIGSEIDGLGALARLMWEPGRVRPWLEGTAALATGWCAGGLATQPRAWVFLTGSPWFFMGNLTDASRGVGLHPDGLFPRPGPIPNGVPPWHRAHVRATFQNLARQAGYKLSTCLRLVATLPRGTRLVLLGDDAESDALAYTALAGWLDGSWSEEAILARVLPRAGDMWRPALEAALRETRDLRGPRVAFVGIRRSGRVRHPRDLAVLPAASLVHDTTDELIVAMKRHEVW
jgi:hypothetical protein